MLLPAMSSITPKSVCESISPLLSKSGNLKGEDEAIKLLESMKDSTKLFQKVIYLNVLKQSQNDSIISTYLNKGGWDLLNSWLTDAKKGGNTVIALEILEVLQQLPVTLALLKQGNMGKVVKSFSKLENKDIKKISLDILEDWMKVVKDNPGGKKKKEKDDEGLSKKDQLLPKKSIHKAKPLAESAGFLDAITTTKTAVPKKVRKRSSTEGERRSLSETVEKTPTTPQDLTPQIPKTKPPKMREPDNERPSAPIIRALLSNSPPPLPEKSHGNDNMYCFRRAKKRRRIRWREELVDVQFFECDESERAGNKSFADSMLKEYEKERLAVLRSRQLGDDVMVEMVPWKHPLKLEGDGILVERGAASKERAIQREREKSVLAVLIFDHNAMPETPNEPDPEELLYNYVPPKVIPLTDPNEQQQQQQPPPVDVAPPPPHQMPPPPHNKSGMLPPVLANMIPPQMQQQQPLQEQQMQFDSYNTMNNAPPPPPRFPHFQQPNPPFTARNGSWYQNNRHSYNDFYDRGRHFRKTKPCAFFNTPQGCRSGDKCTFLHETLRDNNNPTPMPNSRRWDSNRHYHHRGHKGHSENMDKNNDNIENNEKQLEQVAST